MLASFGQMTAGDRFELIIPDHLNPVLCAQINQMLRWMQRRLYIDVMPIKAERTPR
jgi:hypothetical protein